MSIQIFFVKEFCLQALVESGDVSFFNGTISIVLTSAREDEGGIIINTLDAEFKLNKEIRV